MKKVIISWYFQQIDKWKYLKSGCPLQHIGKEIFLSKVNRTGRVTKKKAKSRTCLSAADREAPSARADEMDTYTLRLLDGNEVGYFNMEGTKEETEDRKVLSENHGRQCVKNELKAGGIKFLSRVSTWIGYAAALGFYVNLQVEQYEAIDTKFKEQGKSYVEDLYNRIKSDTTEVMDQI